MCNSATVYSGVKVCYGVVVEVRVNGTGSLSNAGLTKGRGMYVFVVCDGMTVSAIV